MALPNKPLGELAAVTNPEIVEHNVDVLIIGGGMAACGTAFEIKKWCPADMKITLVDKASMERSGAVAQGLSAINTYIGESPIENYVQMVRNDLMGVVREDLIYDLGRHVDDSVHLFEEWGLPVWKKSDDGDNLDGSKPAKTLPEGGQPVRTGKWQIMINGESYKCIVAEPAKAALGEENCLERTFEKPTPHHRLVRFRTALSRASTPPCRRCEASESECVPPHRPNPDELRFAGRPVHPASGGVLSAPQADRRRPYPSPRPKTPEQCLPD